jgi:hypothetical protein
MRIARLRILLLPLVAIAIAVFVTLLAIAQVDQVHLRRAYRVWQENETFAALLADVRRASGVSAGTCAIGAGGTRPLHRTETETEAVIGMRKDLFEVCRAAPTLARDEPFGDMPEHPTHHLKKAMADFTAISPRELRNLAELSTINADDQMKIATLISVLGIAQQIATEIMSGGDGAILAELVRARARTLSGKLAGLFSVSSEMVEDLEGEEEVMRAPRPAPARARRRIVNASASDMSSAGPEAHSHSASGSPR